MNRLRLSSWRHTWRFLGLLVVSGCTTASIPTLTVYETPHSFVRLETDPSVQREAGHSHPASISTEQMAVVLRGIMVQEPWTRVPFYDDLRTPRQHAAFSEGEVEFLAPQLSLALRKATPEELVTFYRSTRASGATREVTSGGVFVSGVELHVVLSNLRSSTHHSADIGVADTEDDRLAPMRSIAPQTGKLSFSPESASRDAAPEGMNRFFHQDRRTLIVLYKMLQPGALTQPQPLAAPPTPSRPR